MKLSLREARKIETRIQAKINEGIVNGRAINIHEELLDDINGTNDWLAETFAMGQESAVVMSGLVSARASIRRAVQATNERVGINELVAKRKEMISIRSVWGEVVQGYDVQNGHAMTGKILQGVVASAKEAASVPSSGYGRTRNDVITVAAISDEMYEQAESKMRSMLRDIDQVEDKLAGLNASTKIELEAELVELLEAQDLL